MNVLFLVSTGLTALVLIMCVVLHTRLTRVQVQAKAQREQLDRIEVGIHSLADLHDDMRKRMDQLATDVLQREIYQNADDRHENAIKDARAGCDVIMLVQRHGLSSDEAALIHALHGRPQTAPPVGVEMEDSSSHTWSGDI
ncbi:hypothetical protein ACUNV4_28595 [Granulosicoccus sp. 3-233]|uniref:hypothetical protein n=1 Tax=Granulosicoccus sp. 3-233 TaxID=3417969 RepID=UPI003D344252